MRNVPIVNETVNYVSFGVSVSLANVNFVIVSPVTLNCVTVNLQTVTVNLVSAAPAIANAVSLTFERMTLILNEIVNIPSSVFCQISRNASWKVFYH